MKKFGFGKSKDKDGSDRSKNSSPAQSANPYLVNQSANDAYASPPPYAGGGGGANDRLRDNKSGGNASDYSGGGRYGAGGGSYGQAGGYGQQSRYGASSGPDDGQPQSRYGSGGYGGLGGAPGGDSGNRYGGPPAAMTGGPGGNRFAGGNGPQGGGNSRYGSAGGDAAPVGATVGSTGGGGSRYGSAGGSDAQSGGRYGSGAGYGGAQGGGYGGAQGAGYGNSAGSGNRYGGAQALGAEQDQQKSDWESGRGAGQGTDYGAYQDRQLTAEEQENEDVEGVKQEIRAIKQQDVSSTRNALRIAQMAEETGRGTLDRLQQQGERIHNTERNLDLASNQNRLAAEKAREIKTLNRSMFAVHVKNPFTSNQRVAEREAKVLEEHQEDRARRDATRAAAWSSNERATRLQMDMNKVSSAGPKGKSSLADRAKYQFEADSEDEEMENEIDGNIDLLAGAAGRMKIIANAMGSEIDSQNKHIERIGGKVDKVDDEIAVNRSRLDRIK